MRKAIIFLALVMAFAISTRESQAGLREAWRRSNLDFWRNNAWPEPFRSRDREITRSFFKVQTDKGWQLHNTIVDELFDSETHELSEAGRIKVRWILTQAPVSRRTVFVMQSDSRELTEKRLDSVQRAVAVILSDGAMPEVLVSTEKPRGGSGDYYNQIQRRVKESIPSPRLPEFQEDQ